MTFDDGPDADLTPRVLDLLDEAGTQATFFCVGARARAHPHLVREIAARGHAVENHAFDHSRAMGFYGVGRLVRDIGDAQKALADITGSAPKFFRAPFGIRTPLTEPALARLGLRCVAWNVRSLDSVDSCADRVAARVVRRLAPGAIVLMHDGMEGRRRRTTAGAPSVIGALPLRAGNAARARLALGDVAQCAARLMRARVARDAAVGASTVRASTDPMVSAESSAARSAPADRIAAGSEPAFRRLVARAASRFRPAGRGPYYFARGKLGGDPVFAALLRDGRITSDARIVDIGCGLGILAALLAAAEQCDPRSASAWPQTWAQPPLGWTLRGFDLRMDAIATAQRALFDIRDRVSLSVGDVRAVTLSECDVVVILDVLHYVDRVAQHALLTNAYSALAPGRHVVAARRRRRTELALSFYVGRRLVGDVCAPKVVASAALEAIGGMDGTAGSYRLFCRRAADERRHAIRQRAADRDQALAARTMMTTTIRSIDISSAERKRRARERLITLTRLMDSAVDVPLLRTTVGLDALLGLVPVAGDLLSAAIGVYLITQARELGASRWLQGKMVGNLWSTPRSARCRWPATSLTSTSVRTGAI